MSATPKVDKKPHLCPPSNAIHPSDRWELLFVYAFICKFTNLRHKVEGLESASDLEEALMLKEPNNILTQVLVNFVVNLKPATRNLSADLISTTVATVLSEYLKTQERTIFWNDQLNANVDPFEGLDGGFFTTDWNFKLKILRQLVELQLCHSSEIKNSIDNAWGVVHNKNKKSQSAHDARGMAKTQEELQLIPIGQDISRKRYWVTDDSPRVYVSTNPWKMTATFQTISTTREEYTKLIEDLQAATDFDVKKVKKPGKLQSAHLSLIDDLEKRIPAIDTELARVQKVRRRLENKRMLLAQAEIRETRTRRRTQKPDYVYGNDVDSEDDGDEYSYREEQPNEYDEEEFGDDDRPRRGRAAQAVGTRRSTRTSALINGNGKRDGSSDSGIWRGERRSSRLGGVDGWTEVEQPRKRARTEESVDSAPSMDSGTNGKVAIQNGVRVKASGAAALKPTEIAMEQIAGKKKSKFWVYAVEPIPDTVHDAPDDNSTSSQQIQDSTANGLSDSGSGTSSPQPQSKPNGHTNGHQKPVNDEDYIMISE
ncbi:hypothetical protein D9619_002860 [Psilocybe cf. subviscida]|uniref:WHIM1 domain-containing protein n=1 Tax=Psilocybe cf. subviscida TaxID=2480587 RepID=A0A8H5AW30_9AGAR|nr:hypothetical protein D9619_002860 [Psilocybe cf. subviscida]